MRKKHYSLCALLLSCILFLTAGCSFQREKNNPPPLLAESQAEHKTLEVTKGSIELIDRRRGNFVPDAQHNLSFKEKSGYLYEIAAASGVRVQKGDVLASLETDEIDRKIEEQLLTVQLAQVDYDESMRITYHNTESAAVKKASILLTMAQTKYDQLLKDKENATIYSPVDGIVTYVASHKMGDFVEARKTVLTVADDTNLYVMIGESTNGVKLEDIALGQRVIVEHSQQEYEGEIVMTPANAPKDAFYSDAPYGLVTLDNIPENAKLGDNATVQFSEIRKEDVIVVPLSAVTQYPKYAYVQVLEDGIRIERAVELGILTPTEAEIVSGLTVGEQIVVR